MNSENQDKQTVPDVSLPVPDAQPVRPGLLRRFFSGIWHTIVERQIIYKIFTLLFAVAVFGYVYMHMSDHHSILTYMGLMLLMVLVYVEILIIRDHLWVIEGSMREARKWRDVFFSKTTLRRQRIRKIFSVLFALAIFSYVYMKVPRSHIPILSFMGIILMITMLYYEILSIRDEVLLMRQSLARSLEENDARDHKTEYDKFLAGNPPIEAVSESVKAEKISAGPVENVEEKKS